MHAKSLDLSQAIVVSPEGLTGIEGKAIIVLIEEIAKLCNSSTGGLEKTSP